jgi:hypothetical protein
MNYSLFSQSETSKLMIGGLSFVYPHGRFGSLAALFAYFSLMSGLEVKRPLFRFKVAPFEGPLSAKSGRLSKPVSLRSGQKAR